MVTRGLQICAPHETGHLRKPLGWLVAREADRRCWPFLPKYFRWSKFPDFVFVQFWYYHIFHCFFSNVGMRSVPNTLPSLKFPNFGNASCCPCFSCFFLFFLPKKKRRKSGQKLFDTNGPESCSPLCNATIHINSFSIETILCRCFVRAPGWIGCVITYNRGIF